MKKLIFLLVLISNISFAFTDYELRSGKDPICDASYIELRNRPPVLDQGLHGLCYAFSTTSILEYLRCSKSINPNNCYQNKPAPTHLARYNNTYNDTIAIGGSAKQIMAVFQNVRTLVPESCMNYGSWEKLNKEFEDKIKEAQGSDSYDEDKDFFFFLTKEIYKKDEATLSCYAQKIVDSGMQKNLQEVMKILRTSDSDWNALRFKLLLPKECFNNFIQYPDYTIENYPQDFRTPKTVNGAKNFVYQSLKAGFPVEANFCAEVYNDGKCGGHSVMLVGQRYVCDNNGCDLQFRIQNSYGQTWQDTHDNGWVNADNLISNMMMLKGTMNTIMPKGYKIDKLLTYPVKERFPVENSSKVALASRFDSLGSEEKCYVSSSDYEIPKTEPTPPPTAVEEPAPLKPSPQVKPNRTNPGKKPSNKPAPIPAAPSVPEVVQHDEQETPSAPRQRKLYICRGEDGKAVFTDYEKEGMVCEEKKF
ncbi:MAG: hypothetical protein AB7I27_14580 [Bacteriovoracaceae bacterium]